MNATDMQRYKRLLLAKRDELTTRTNTAGSPAPGANLQGDSGDQASADAEADGYRTGNGRRDRAYSVRLLAGRVGDWSCYRCRVRALDSHHRTMKANTIRNGPSFRNPDFTRVGGWQANSRLAFAQLYGSLVRNIETFRRVGESYTRHREVHRPAIDHSV